MTTAQLSNLYQKGSIIVMGLINGVMDSSSVIQLLVKLAHDSGFKRKYSYFIIMGVSLVTVLSTFLLFPRYFIYKTGETKKHTIEERKGSGSEQICLQTIKRKLSSVDFRKNVINPIFIPHILWFGIMMLHFNFYIATINTYLNYVTNENDDQVSYFTNVLSYTMFCGLVSSFMAGYLYDWQKQKYKESGLLIHRKIMPVIVPMMIATILELSLSVLVMIPGTNVLYLAFINFTVFRSFLFCVAMSFLSDAFPTKAFGVLYTVMLTMSSIMHWAEYGVFAWWKAYDGGMQHVHIFLLVLSVLAFLHPAILWYQCRRLLDQDNASALRYFSALEEDKPDYINVGI